MDEILVKSKSHIYPIYIGENIRFEIKHLLPKQYSSILIISDDKVAPLYLDKIIDSLDCDSIYSELIPAGENAKSIDNFYKLQTKAIQYNLDRESLIIALGGGVVGDLAGFVASTYMRGIDYIQIPTTILAHDSSVGGKVAINHELGKNLIGSFYPPKMVIYDIQTLSTLPQHEIRSGYAELIKEALIADGDLFDDLLKTNLNNVDPNKLKTHLIKGINIKRVIVEQDEKELGNRKFLNLGHTLAHALETVLGYGKITHGEAVAIGLLFAIYVSEKIYAIRLPYQELLTWLEKNDYPTHLESVDIDSIISKMKADKKAINQSVQMVLLQQLAKPTVAKISDEDLRSYLKTFLKDIFK